MKFSSLLCATMLVSFPAAAGETDKVLQIIQRNLAPLQPHTAPKKSVLPLPDFGVSVNEPAIIADRSTTIAMKTYRGTYMVPITEKLSAGLQSDESVRSGGFGYRLDNGNTMRFGTYTNKELNRLLPPEAKSRAQTKIWAMVHIPF